MNSWKSIADVAMKVCRRAIVFAALLLLITVIVDLYNLKRLVTRVNAIGECVGMEKEVFLEMKVNQFSEEWGCRIKATEYNSKSDDPRIILTITSPFSISAYLFTDYTNLVYIGLKEGRISCVFCVM